MSPPWSGCSLRARRRNERSTSRELAVEGSCSNQRAVSGRIVTSWPRIALHVHPPTRADRWSHCPCRQLGPSVVGALAVPGRAGKATWRSTRSVRPRRWPRSCVRERSRVVIWSTAPGADRTIRSATERRGDAGRERRSVARRRARPPAGTGGPRGPAPRSAADAEGLLGHGWHTHHGWLPGDGRLRAGRRRRGRRPPAQRRRHRHGKDERARTGDEPGDRQPPLRPHLQSLGPRPHARRVVGRRGSRGGSGAVATGGGQRQRRFHP